MFLIKTGKKNHGFVKVNRNSKTVHWYHLKSYIILWIMTDMICQVYSTNRVNQFAMLKIWRVISKIWLGCQRYPSCKKIVCTMELKLFWSHMRNFITLLVFRSEYPRNKPFLLTMVSYSKKNRLKYKREKNPTSPFGVTC